jgi:hypothetical protein
MPRQSRSTEEHDARLIIKYLEDQITMLEDPSLPLTPLEYLKLQFAIECNRLNQLTAKTER